MKELLVGAEEIMKKVNWSWVSQLNVAEGIAFVWLEWCRQKLPLIVFLLLCLDLVIAPAVYATAGTIERRSAWAIGILGLVTLGLVIYLFDVVFRPERY